MADADQGSAASIDTAVVPSRDATYRIAVLGQDTGVWFTWRRVYTVNPDFHDATYDPYTAAEADIKVAAAEYPGRDMRVEVLVDNNDETFTTVPNDDGTEARASNGDGTHSWVPVGEEG